MKHEERENIELGDEFSDTSSSSHLCLYSICHEEEEMEGNTMEAPCGCSGTLKFAHRGYIQRWCDEKGNTTCEICLQVLVLRSYGILLPFYLIIRIVSAIQHSYGQQGQRVEVMARVEENLEIQHIIEIQP